MLAFEETEKVKRKAAAENRREIKLAAEKTKASAQKIKGDKAKAIAKGEQAQQKKAQSCSPESSTVAIGAASKCSLSPRRHVVSLALYLCPLS